MVRCTKCVLPEVYPAISFDDQGVCNYCRSHKKIEYLGSAKLEDHLNKYKNSAGNYDCLVPLSGGKDSTFVLYQMKNKYGMRVLAYNYNNCLTHPQAQQNVHDIAKLLDVDLVSKNNEKQKKYMATNLKALMRKPSAAMVPMLCTGCRYGIIGNAMKIAKKHRIPMIVIGWSPIEDTPFKEILLKGDGISVIGGLALNIFKNPTYARLGNMVAAMKDYYHNYSHVKDWNFVLKALYPGIKLVQFYEYIEYDPDKIQDIVERELKWKTPDKENSWQFDCKIKLLQNYFYEREIGFTAIADYLSAMIREGFIDRLEAMRRLESADSSKDGKINQIKEMLKDIGQHNLADAF